MSVPSFSSKIWLAIALVVALISAVAWQIISSWGLITIDADNKPLSEVVRAIEKQGHVTLKTNLDLQTPVTMNVERVPLTDALETLSTVTESQWRFITVAAADAGTVKAAFSDYYEGGNKAGWISVRSGGGFFGQMLDGPPLDPRRDVVVGQESPDLQAWLRTAGMETDATFLVQTDWNPALNKLPKSGRVDSAIPKAIRSAGGKSDSFFALVSGGGGWGGGPPGQSAGGDAPPQGGGGDRGGFDPSRMADMQKATERRIANLPAEVREVAKAQFDEQRAFFDKIKDLPEDQRREAFRAEMEKRMADPTFQERMEERMSSRDARRTPEQRLQRYKDYVSRKLQAEAKE